LKSSLRWGLTCALCWEARIFWDLRDVEEELLVNIYKSTLRKQSVAFRGGKIRLDFTIFDYLVVRLLGFVAFEPGRSRTMSLVLRVQGPQACGRRAAGGCSGDQPYRQPTAFRGG
jgi:hypothetical protein